MTADTIDPTSLEHDYDPDELFQSEPVVFGESSGDQREYDYPLTAFVPKASAPIGSKNIPPEAAYWVIPDINDVELVRMLKLFKTTFLDKVPAPYNEVYIRVNRQNKPNPTPFQESLWDAVVSRMVNQDGKPPAAQMYMLPVISRYKGEWTPTIAEMTVKVYGEVKKAIALADDSSDGRVTLRTYPLAIWKPAAREIEIRFDKGFDGSVKQLIAEYSDQMLRPRDYIKKRAAITEKWLRESWRKFNDGEIESVVTDTFTDTERFVDKVMNLPSPVMKRILADAGISISGARNRTQLSDLIIANSEVLRPAVEALDANDPPF